MATKPRLRPATPADLPALSALSIRSKAHWGYDAAFMAACRADLTLTEDDLVTRHVQLAERDGTALGTVSVSRCHDPAELSALFVDPPCLGTGLGRQLFDWAVGEARRQNARALRLDSDPHAEAFYLAMGMSRIGQSPSGSIPGRVLPLLEMRLR